MLAGIPDPRLARSGLDATKTFGILKDKSPEWILALLRRCVTAGWVDFTTGDRPMVLLTPAGKVVLFGDGPVRVLLPPDETARPKTRASGGGSKRKTAATPDLDPADTALFEALRARRLELARAGGVPPYVVASDRTLRELAELKPRTLAALEGIYGIGPAKAARYGKDLLAVLRRVE